MNIHYTFRKAAWVINTLYAYLVPQNLNFNIHVYTRREAAWAVHTSYMYNAKASSLARSPLGSFVYILCFDMCIHIYVSLCYLKAFGGFQLTS